MSSKRHLQEMTNMSDGHRLFHLQNTFSALTLNPSPSWRGTLNALFPFALREKGPGDEGRQNQKMISDNPLSQFYRSQHGVVVTGI
jgi:hypothetical protein